MIKKKAASSSVEAASVVGVTGIEPMTSPTRTERATKLRHTPNTPEIIGQVGYFASPFTICCSGLDFILCIGYDLCLVI